MRLSLIQAMMRKNRDGSLQGSLETKKMAASHYERATKKLEIIDAKMASAGDAVSWSDQLALIQVQATLAVAEAVNKLADVMKEPGL